MRAPLLIPSPKVGRLPQPQRVQAAAQAICLCLSPTGLRRLVRRGEDEFVRNARRTYHLGDGFAPRDLPLIYRRLATFVSSAWAQN